MMRWMVLAALVASAGCSNKKLEWGEKKSTKLTAGPFEVAIPAGWRDAAETTTEEIKAKQQPGVAAMMPEAPQSRTPAPSIMLSWAAMQARLTPPTCAVFAELIGKPAKLKTSDIVTSVADHDQVCRFKLTNDTSVGTEAARFMRDHILIVQCLRSPTKDQAIDAVCAQVIASLHLDGAPAQPPP